VSAPTSRDAPAATVADCSERELIARISERLPVRPGWLAVGIGDDAAVVEPERNRLEVLSVDALVDGVHFDRSFTPPAAIGHRALAVNLSDLAAMGATPRLALVSLALPHSLSLAEFDQIMESLIALAGRYRIAIAGGNLTRIDGPLVIDITVLGTVKRRQVLTRSGARAGDDLYVSGTVGTAAAGLQMLRERPVTSVRTSVSGRASDPVDDLAAESCIHRYLYPEPRLRLGSLLGRNRAAMACMDSSDGLADAVRQLAEASGVGATIDAEAVPLDAGARRWFEQRGADAVREAITGGDDYELLIAVRPRGGGRLTAAMRHGGTPLTRIGTCTADPALVLRQNGSRHQLPRGYSHFR
jgi:thiamine-monophosphate kinase